MNRACQQRLPKGWKEFLGLVALLRPHTMPWPAEFESLRRWYAEPLERLHDDAQIRQTDIDQLEKIAATYPSRQRFLTELTLDPPDATSDEAGVPLRDEDYLILSTIHSAKGQEWKAVYLLNAVDGCLPSDLATGSPGEVEEERRLLYVAMTRAKDHLDIMVPQRFFVSQQSQFGDRHVYAGRTRFIPASLLHLFEARAWPVVEPVAADHAGGPSGTSRGLARQDQGDVACQIVSSARQLPCQVSKPLKEECSNLYALPELRYLVEFDGKLSIQMNRNLTMSRKTSTRDQIAAKLLRIDVAVAQGKPLSSACQQCGDV